VIGFLDAPQPESSTVEFVGGPRAGERDVLDERPLEINFESGSYRRSVQCADDGALRYIWTTRQPESVVGPA
jgi:hypothetical protein